MIGNSVFEPTCTKCVKAKKYKETYITGVECSAGGEHQLIEIIKNESVSSVEGSSVYHPGYRYHKCWKCGRRVKE